MDEPISESLVWLKQLKDLEDQLQKNPSSRRAELKAVLNLGDTQISGLQNIRACFDPAALEKVRQAASGHRIQADGQDMNVPVPKQGTGATRGSSPYSLSSKSAVALAALKGKVPDPDLPGAVHAALDVILTRRLKTRHIKALVDWIAAGHPAVEFKFKKAKNIPVHRPQAEEQALGVPVSEKGTGIKTTHPKPQPVAPPPPVSPDEPKRSESGNGVTQENPTPSSTQAPVLRTQAEEQVLDVPIINKGVKEIGTMPTSDNSGDEGRYVPVPESGTGAPVPTPPAEGADSLLKLVELAKKAGAEEALGGSTAAREQLAEYLKKMAEDNKKSTAPEPPKENGQTNPSTGSTGLTTGSSGLSGPAPKQKLSELGKLLWLAFLGVSIYKQVKAKVNKGENPSYWILLLLILTQLVGWGWSFFWRFPRFCGKHFWRALEKLGQIFPDLKRLVQFLSSVAIVALVVWLGWKIYNHSFHPISYLESKIHLSFSKPQIPESVPAPVVASVPEPTKVEKHLFKPAERPTKNTIGQTVVTSLSSAGGPTAFNGDDEQKALLEQAIATIVNGHFKFFPVTPDSSMGSLMAVNRVDDLQVEGEYSLRVGQSGLKVTSITPSSTGLIIVAEGGPLDSFFGGGLKSGFYWEDVQTIYCMELDTPSGKFYYFVLTATNLNQPLVVQCNTTNNLKHLVSAFEYFIKSAQGKYVPVTGMPYLNQGMVLGDENKITALWEGSPADKAQLELGDRVWLLPHRPQADGQALNAPIPEGGIGDSGDKQQEKADLEAALDSLPSGKHTIEVVTPKDWDAEVEKEARLKSKNFHPNLLEFQLAVP